MSERRGLKLRGRRRRSEREDSSLEREEDRKTEVEGWNSDGGRDRRLEGEDSSSEAE